LRKDIKVNLLSFTICTKTFVTSPLLTGFFITQFFHSSK